MNRRDFLLLTATVSLAAPMAAQTALAAPPVPYAPGMVRSALKQGKVVFLDFHATWCSTCAAQTRVIDALRAGDPAYDKAIDFVVVDWDRFKDSDIARRLKVRQRATLIVLKGDRVLGRLDWETGRAKIKALMDTAVAAATSA